MGSVQIHEEYNDNQGYISRIASKPKENWSIFQDYDSTK